MPQEVTVSPRRALVVMLWGLSLATGYGMRNIYFNKWYHEVPLSELDLRIRWGFCSMELYRQLWGIDGRYRRKLPSNDETWRMMASAVMLGLWWWWHIAECWLDYEYWWLFTFRQDRRWWDGKRMTDAWFNKWVVLNSVDLRWILMLLSVLLWGDLKNLDECWKSNNLSDRSTEHRVLSRNDRYYQKLNKYSVICNRTL